MHQEYNWRKEREKYRPDFMKPPEAAEPPPPVVKRSNTGVIATVIIVAVLTVAAVAAISVKRQRTSGDPATMLAQAAERHKSAVGLVVLTAELQNGGKVPRRIGTAWAFAPDKFATNAHVARALTWECAQEFIAVNMLKELAKQNGFENVKSFLKSLGESRAKELVAKCWAEAAKSIRGVEASILINGAYRRSYPVRKVQIHRAYGVTGSNFDPDAAVLTIDGEHDVHFKLAGDDTLAALKSGEPIAFLGFPTENLINNNVNLDNPVASMQSGIVVAVSDFDMKDAGPSGNYLIRHNLPSTGGASGSPIFNRNGEVVALLFAGNTIGQVHLRNGQVGRAPSAAQINFAVRSDLLRGMGNPIDINEFLAR